jgi:creatinine amidohydrolase
MALAPDTVQMSRAVANYPPEFPCPTLSADGRPAAAWTARDFGETGVIGDPLPATAEQGHAILDSLAESWARGITELHQMRWLERDAQTWGRAHQTGDVLGG